MTMIQWRITYVHCASFVHAYFISATNCKQHPALVLLERDTNTPVCRSVFNFLRMYNCILFCRSVRVEWVSLLMMQSLVIFQIWVSCTYRNNVPPFMCMVHRARKHRMRFSILIHATYYVRYAVAGESTQFFYLHGSKNKLCQMGCRYLDLNPSCQWAFSQCEWKSLEFINRTKA